MKLFPYAFLVLPLLPVRSIFLLKPFNLSPSTSLYFSVSFSIFICWVLFFFFEFILCLAFWVLCCMQYYMFSDIYFIWVLLIFWFLGIRSTGFSWNRGFGLELFSWTWGWTAKIEFWDKSFFLFFGSVFFLFWFCCCWCFVSEMGSTSGEAKSNVIDASVGGLVWVRRRNGSWWPGRIMGIDELSEGSLVSPRSGTPVKLLGREDASVWVCFTCFLYLLALVLNWVFDKFAFAFVFLFVCAVFRFELLVMVLLVL